MSDYTVACYYFPNYHPDPRNAAKHGTGWTEWELVKQARPGFPGHRQPRIPRWGFADESRPDVMAEKIDAAADHHIDVFIFDWYYYDDGPFLERAVERGFMQAANNHRLKFALMWANHDWVDIHPAAADATAERLYPGTVTRATFEAVTDLLVERYFSHRAYWRIEDRPYFSIYELHTLIKSFGGVEATAAALERFRQKVRHAGLPGLHLNAVSWGVQLLPGETVVSQPEMLVQKLGFDSVTSYVWIHDIELPHFPATSYAHVRRRAASVWQRQYNRFGVPYFPNVTMGWDASPRCRRDHVFENRGYPFMPVLEGNSPPAFQQALEQVRAFLHANPECNNTLTINCWNEWTEGSYLEPDTVHGNDYLEAIKKVFPQKRGA